MNYLSQPLSAKLEKLGVKSDAKRWWVVFVDSSPDILISDPRAMENFDHCEIEISTALSLSDILNPDNLRILYGADNLDVLENWEYQGQKLLEAFWANGIKGLEKYLEKITNNE